MQPQVIWNLDQLLFKEAVTKYKFNLFLLLLRMLHELNIQIPFSRRYFQFINIAKHLVTFFTVFSWKYFLVNLGVTFQIFVFFDMIINQVSKFLKRDFFVKKFVFFVALVLSIHLEKLLMKIPRSESVNIVKSNRFIDILD